MSLLSPPGVSMAQMRRGLVPLHPRATPLAAKPAELASGIVTLTWQADNAATSIAGATRKPPWQNPDLRFLHAEQQLASSSVTGLTGCVESKPLTGTTGGSRGVVETSVYGTVFEAFFQCVTTSAMRTRLWVDGQPVSWTVEAGLGSGNAPKRLRVEFATRGHHAIRLEWVSARFLGFVHTAASAKFYPPRKPVGPTWAEFGDSFSEGSGGQWWWDSWIMHMARILGWNIIPVPVGSTGYRAAPAPKVAYVDRLGDLPAQCDGIILTGGFNDVGSFDQAAEQAAVEALHAALIAGWPSAAILQFGPNMPKGITATGIETNLRDAIRSAVTTTNTAYPGRVIAFIDPVKFPDGSSYLSGSGKVGATTGDGTADWATGSDGTHPTTEGHELIGMLSASDVIAAFTALGIA